MGSFETSLGETYVLERRLPPIGWWPNLRSVDLGGGDFGSVDDLGILAVVGLFLLALALVVFVLPFLVFVLELALVVAIVIPLTVLAVVLGLKRHLVELGRGDGRVLDVRPARGVLGSRRAARELRRAAESGAYRGLPAGPAAAP